MSDPLHQLVTALTDRYHVDRELGRGGMAVVFLAHDEKLDRKVALKVLRPELAATIGTERFLREIEITAKLTHPNILPLHDCGQAGGICYYVMPYVDGESLRHRLSRDRQLSIDDALRITTEVAEALAHAHALGIVHRDVKPENVLFQAGHALVADFGIARAASVAGGERLTETGIALGTPAYMAPEQATGDRDIDARSDIYSLACMTYEMLAGEPPFAASTAQGILARKCIEAVPPLTHLRETVPEHVAHTVETALARVPADRYATVRDFVAALTAPHAAHRGGWGRRAIAVLPFANMSADPENEYFSDGITEEVINAVAGIPNLRVTARTSVFGMKGKDADVREIGRKLNVGTVLEGSVRKIGNRVRVTAQLVDVADGYHLWSERFDRELEDAFAIQDEIAHAIAVRLSSDIALPRARTDLPRSVSAKKPTPAAYEAYLRGRYHRRQMFAGAQALDRAITCYRDAIKHDPQFAPAYSALAEAYTVQALGFAVRPSRELMPEALRAAERALSLDTGLAEAHLSRAVVAMFYEWDHDAAKTGIDRAIAINPSFVDAHFWAEFYHTYVERSFERALTTNRRAAEIDPLDLLIRTRLAQVLIIFGHVDEAIEELRAVLQLEPNHMAAHLELADAYARRGDAALSATHAELALRYSNRAVAALGVAGVCYSTLGAIDQAKAILEELTECANQTYTFAFWLAPICAGLGDMDRAFSYLAQALQDRDCNLLYLTATPPALGWHDDPRFRRVLEEIGLRHLTATT